MNKVSKVVKHVIEWVDPKELNDHPDNPRKHPKRQTEALVRSVEKFGFIDPIIALRNGNTIVAGHDRKQAALMSGQEEVPVIFLDMDQSDAEAYMIANNQITLMGSWDEPKMSEIVLRMSEKGYPIESTGLPENYLRPMVEAAREVKEELPVVSEERIEDEVARRTSQFEEGQKKRKEIVEKEGVEWWKNDADFAPEEKEELEGTVQKEELAQLTVPNPFPIFISQNKYEIPELDASKIAPIPSKILTFMNRPNYLHLYEDPDMTLLVVVGSSGQPKMEDRERSIYCFYSYDVDFGLVYNDPINYIQAMRGEGYETFITPNFSTYRDEPFPVQLFAVYRARWVGKLWQEHGLGVIPDVTWSNVKSFDYCFEGLPQGIPISVQSQTQDDRVSQVLFMRGLEQVAKRINPSQILIYGRPNPGEDILSIFGDETEVIGVPTRMGIVMNTREDLKERMKKRLKRQVEKASEKALKTKIKEKQKIVKEKDAPKTKGKKGNGKLSKAEAKKLLVRKPAD